MTIIIGSDANPNNRIEFSLLFFKLRSRSVQLSVSMVRSNVSSDSDSADIPLTPSLARLKQVTSFMYVAQELMSNMRKDLRLEEQKEEKRRSSSSKQDDDLEEQRESKPRHSSVSKHAEGSGGEKRRKRKLPLPLPLSKTKKEQEEKGTGSAHIPLAPRIMNVRTGEEEETRTTQKRPLPLPLWKRKQKEKQGKASDDTPLAPRRKKR